MIPKRLVKPSRPSNSEAISDVVVLVYDRHTQTIHSSQEMPKIKNNGQRSTRSGIFYRKVKQRGNNVIFYLISAYFYLYLFSFYMYSNPVKDWFYFTRRQRQGIVMLLILIFWVPIASKILESCKRARTIDTESFFREARTFEEQLAALEDISRQRRGSGDSTSHSQGKRPAGELQLTPFPFDPNTMSQAGWDSLGVPGYLGRTIGNYLAAGGSFRYREDLKRIYLMEDDIYRQLETFIQLPERPAMHMGRDKPGEAIDHRERPFYDRETLTININQADSTEMQQIRGIGPVFGRRIVRYRELLGGFHCTTQLLEVFGMDTVRFDQIKPYVITDTLNIRRLDLNQAAFADLVRHPYIDRAVANAILNLHKQHGPFMNTEEIKQSYLIDEEVWQRIAPYVTATKTVSRYQ